MVNDRGQLYTIEGFAAGLIMLLTAYFAVSSTSVYTAGDAHISDMQLEAIGTDALRMMDIPANITPRAVTKSPLQHMVETKTGEGGIEFGRVFNSTVNNMTSPSKYDRIHFNASYVYRSSTDDTTYTQYLNSSRFLTGGEHTVRVSKWVIVETDGPPPPAPGGTNFIGQRERAVLVEVLLWRD
jgi:hypothetical protein